ncbi:MAG: hypothetical protein GXO79_14405 [Chlorobi bacterium]|nr:hypothetical protein [Chlorobiota bacterium]
MIQELGIIDTKKIISAIQEYHNFDFSNYSLTTFKRRILKVVNQLGFLNIADFISNLNDIQLFEKIINEITIDTTEMFRDPPVWRELRDKYLPELYKNRDFKIWFPEISSGDEIFSLAIVLKEIGLLNNTKILVTGLSNKKINLIKNGGVFDIKKMEISEANYKRYSGKFQLSNYYKLQNNKIIFNSDLIKGIVFKQQNLINDKSPGNFRMIIYRNKLLYFNISLQDKVVTKILNSLMPGGLLFIGNKETLESTSVYNKFSELNPLEKIYKKRVI